MGADAPRSVPGEAGHIARRGVDAVGEVETRGTDFIPEAERHGKASDLFWIWMAGQFSLGIIVVGSLPVLFGLGWWSSLTALTIGIAIGSILFTPLALFGPRLGTNDPVASGAHFGVTGRLLGAAISVFVALGFYALTVWTGGQAVMVAGNKLFDWPTNNTALAISMAIVAVVTILVAVYGHATLIATYKLFTILVGVFLLALIIVQIPDFDAGYSGGAYLLGTFWPTWFLSVSVGASLPISYATFGGDYSRYFSRKTVTDRSIIFWNGLGMFLSNWIALGAGAFLTTMFIDFNDAFVVGVADSIPRWFLTPFLIFAILGTWPQGALCLYGCGLSTTTISWRVAGRALTTVVLSIIGLGVVYIGTIVFDAIDSISAFVLIMNSTISPWMAIMLIGLYLRRGRYAPLDVQPYMGLESKSIYWFTYGVNLRAFTAWVPAAVIGFLFSNTTLYVGPFANAVKGIDLSYGSAFAIAAVLYFVLVKIFPERGVVPSEEAERGEIPPTAVPA